MRSSFLVILFVVLSVPFISFPALSADPPAGGSSVPPIQLLTHKGVLTTEEARSISRCPPAGSATAGSPCGARKA
jgi:hypothetical protein